MDFIGRVARRPARLRVDDPGRLNCVRSQTGTHGLRHHAQHTCNRTVGGPHLGLIQKANDFPQPWVHAISSFMLSGASGRTAAGVRKTFLRLYVAVALPVVCDLR